MPDNNINIYGNASGVQIQQGSYNSTQTQENSNLCNADIEKFQTILDQINKCRPQFEDEFGEKADELIAALDQAQEALNKKDQSLWRKTLSFVRDLAVEVSGGLIASGIVGLIAPIL